MNLRDNDYVEMSFVNSSTYKKSNDTYPELKVFSYSDDIIENIDILYPDINYLMKKLIQHVLLLLYALLLLLFY